MESLPSDISSLSISNQKYTFTLLPTENIIPKTAFIDKFINISTVKYDGQGINYVELSLGRDIVREDRNDKVVPKMENSESSLAKLARFKGLGRQKKDIFYQFSKCYTNVKGAFLHEQMRRNVLFISKNELLYKTSDGFEMLDIVTNMKYTVLFVDEEDNQRGTFVTCFDAYRKGNKIILAFGKMNSIGRIYELEVKDINKELKTKKFDVIKKMSIRIQDGDTEAICAIEFTPDKTKIMTADNLGQILFWDYNTLNIIMRYQYKFAVNNCCYSERYNLLSCVVDHEEVVNFDYRTQELLHKLKGHKDYGFVCKFNNDYTLATGNQDISCKLWDVRKFDKESSKSCYKTLYGRLSSIGNLKFIRDDLIAYFENADYFHIYDIANDKIQNIEYFGQTVGAAVSDITSKIYIGYIFRERTGLLVYELIDMRNMIDNIML